MSGAAEERLATLVGLGALALGLCAAFFVVAISPGLARRGHVPVRLYLTELGGLREGAPVRAAGAEIGHVASISLSPAAAPGPLGGQVGVVVELALATAELRRTWREGSAVISSRGVLSARYVELLPPAGEPGPPLRAGDEVRGVDPPVLDRVLLRTWNNLRITRRFAEEVSPAASQLRRELRALAAAVAALRAEAGEGRGTSPAQAGGGPSGADPLDSLSAELAAVLDEADRTFGEVLGGRAGWTKLLVVAARAQALRGAAQASWAALSGQVTTLQGDLSEVLARIAARAPGAKVAAVLAQGRAVVAKLAVVAASAQLVWQRWQRREGSLGRLLADPEFPEDAKELGKILKRQPWRIFGRPPEETGGEMKRTKE